MLRSAVYLLNIIAHLDGLSSSYSWHCSCTILVINMEINTKEMAYILGFIWADGWVRKTKQHNEIRVECIREDLDELYPSFLKTFDWKIYYRNREKRKPSARLNLSNKTFVSFLLENDYNPHNIKSADKILSIVPSELHPFWFRGIIDGDGCWYYNKKKHLRQFSLAGAYDQNWSFFENLLNSIGSTYNTIKRTQGKNKHSLVRITNKNSLTNLGNYIYESYENDSLGLERKFKKWKEIISSFRDGR